MNVSRRTFLSTIWGTSAMLSLGGASTFRRQKTLSETVGTQKEKDTVLVVLELKGGNDGLNTVIPYTEAVYHTSRPTLHVSPRKVVKLNSRFGLHPELKELADLFKKGALTVIHGVGHRGLSQNHEEAMRAWQTGFPDRPACATGWLGRAIDSLARQDPLHAKGAFIGSIAMPFTLRTENAVVPRIRSTGELILKSRNGRTGGFPPVSEPGDRTNPLLGFLTKAVNASVSESQNIDKALAVKKEDAYPPFQLADKFRTIATLIRAGTGIRVFYTDLGGGGFGGFDNHANQAENHAALLNQLSTSLAAFMEDLKHDGLDRRVLVMTFSEFGRTVAENGRRGTGHGNAAPLLLAGGGIKGGFIGTHPSLTDTVSGSQKPHIDFRRVYAAVLDSWLGVDSKAIFRELFPFIPELFM